VLKTPADQYNFLVHVGSRHVGQIFSSEISFGLLGDMMNVLNSEYNKADSSELVAVLEALSSTNRFSLSLQFLDKTERTACSQLLQRLHQTFVECTDETSQQLADTVISLMSVYNV